MIIVRSPLRISLGGGGTDLPSYYTKHGGYLISAAINKYVYITLHENFADDLIIKYSKFERVKNRKEIEHPIIREAFDLVGINNMGLELSSMADIPAGTGLGSSSSFTTAVLKTLHVYNKNIISTRELAEQACDIELNRLKEPIGKQDQFISAYGGITEFTFEQNGNINVNPLKLSTHTFEDLTENLLLFFTGYSRSASSILKEQDQKSKTDDSAMIENLNFVKDIGLKSKAAFESGDLCEFANLMNVHWEYKKHRSKSMSNDKINYWYDLALKNGAIGGKLIGVGGGGFLMFYSENKTKLRQVLRENGLIEVKFSFDFEGTKQILA
jgi:D-glycero-alpha-D-manno-heptose-7-phosphate kinase